MHAGFRFVAGTVLTASVSTSAKRSLTEIVGIGASSTSSAKLALAPDPYSRGSGRRQDDACSPTGREAELPPGRSGWDRLHRGCRSETVNGWATRGCPHRCRDVYVDHRGHLLMVGGWPLAVSRCHCLARPTVARCRTPHNRAPRSRKPGRHQSPSQPKKASGVPQDDPDVLRRCIFDYGCWSGRGRGCYPCAHCPRIGQIRRQAHSVLHVGRGCRVFARRHAEPGLSNWSSRLARCV